MNPFGLRIEVYSILLLNIKCMLLQKYCLSIILMYNACAPNYYSTWLA